MICGLLVNDQTGFSLTAGTEKVLATMLAATNQRPKLRAIRAYTNGTSGTDASIHFGVYRVTAAGSGASTVTASTIGRFGAESETPQTVIKHSYSTEPTLGNRPFGSGFHPQATLPESFPPGGEIFIPGGGEIAIAAKSPSAKTIYLYLEWEE